MKPFSESNLSDANSGATIAPPSGAAGSFSLNYSGLLGCLSGMIEKLSELTAAGEELARSGELCEGGDLIKCDERVHGVYGINVHMGRDEFGRPVVMVEPFGNVSRDIFFAPLSADVREPLANIGETDRCWFLAMETPGVEKEAVQVEAANGRLRFCAQTGKTTYRKEIDLPDGCDPRRMTWDCKNGIVTVEFEKE